MSEQLFRGGLPVTAQQAVVVDHALTYPATVVGAGAGSGKTHVTVATVLELLDQERATLDQFVLITFTDKAADELRARLEWELAGRAAAADARGRRFWDRQRERLTAAYVGTIHGFCRSVLTTYGYNERVARESNVTFARQLLRDALADAAEELLVRPDDRLLNGEVDWPPYRLAQLGEEILTAVLNRGLNPSAVRDETERQPADAGHPYRVAVARYVARAAELHAAAKRERQALDGHDLLTQTAALLTGPGGPAVAGRLARRHRYLFVDEFQDTDGLQKQIIDALRGRLDGVLVVGDRKQSVYGFRGARSFLAELAREAGGDVLPLNVSRRPTKPLLDVQNALFREIGRRYPSLDEPLEPRQEREAPRSGIPPLTYVSVAGGRDPAPRVAAAAAQIRDLLRHSIDDPVTGGLRPLEPGDVAVVVRSNRQLREYERGLGRWLGPAVRVRALAGGLFYQKPEVVSTYRMLLALLRHPDDNVLSQALATPYLRDVPAGRLEQLAVQYGGRPDVRPLTDAFESDYPEAAGKLRELRGMARSATVPQILGALYESFGIQAYYRGVGDDQAAENLEKLRELARGMFRQEQALTLRQFVDALRRSLLARADEDEAPLGAGSGSNRPPYVRLLTVHRAKGLEFPVVIIPELQAQLRRGGDPEFLVIPGWGLEVDLPLTNGQDARSPRFAQDLAAHDRERIEEELRIFYVAVTRAQHALVLIAGGPDRVNPPTSEYYSWKDEVLAAWPALEALGAIR